MTAATVLTPIAEPAEPAEEPGVLPRRWTREEYHRAGELGLLREDERLELIKGEIVQKVSPKKTPHSVATSKTIAALEDAFGLGFHARAQEPLVLPNDSEPEPDVLVVPGVPDDYLDEHPTASDARLVVEVSDTTLRYDRGTKAALYAEANITDYWIVNLRERRLEVYRDPVALPTGGPFGYRSVTLFLETNTVFPLAAPDAVLQVSDLLPMPRTASV